MFPVVQPAVAYLVFSGLERVSGAQQPTNASTMALVIGTLLADLVDQPLFVVFDLPSTRTFAHSVLLAVPICALVVLAIRRSHLSNGVGVGFSVGYLTHLAADAFWPLVLGIYDELGFLLWPVTHSPAYDGQKVLFTIGETPFMTYWIELVLLVIGLAVWWQDGRPGLPSKRHS